MNMIFINGEPLPGKLVGYKGTLIDVDGKEAGTTEDGYTIRDVRRRNKGKIFLKFDGLTREQFSAIMAAIDESSFTVKYFCGFYRTITAYAGDKNWELIKSSAKGETRWRLDFNIIEL